MMGKPQCYSKQYFLIINELVQNALAPLARERNKCGQSRNELNDSDIRVFALHCRQGYEEIGGVERKTD